MRVVKIGIIGMGHISNCYCQNLNTVHDNTRIIACTDIDLEAARVKAEKWGIDKVVTVDQLLAMEEIEIVVNLTPPQNHYSITRQCLLAGKHVYSEKPIAITTDEADDLVELAKSKGLLLGCAPETNYGAGVSTAKVLLEQGVIGKVLYADARFRWPGDENWHPNPAFLYQKGAGPLFDRGPYFLNILVDLLGKADSVFAMASIGFPERTITSEPRKGQVFPVETPSHVQSLIRFRSGVQVSTTFSFDMKCPKGGAIELFGTEGSILITEPISFGSPVYLCRNAGQYEQVPLVNDRTGNIRGYAVADMAKALTEKRTEHLASGTRAHHVLEIMEKTLQSAQDGKLYTVGSEP